MEKFLSLILPPVERVNAGLQPCYYMVGLANGAIPDTEPFMFVSQVPAMAAAMSGRNVYFTPASFKDPCFGRKAANAKEVKSLWLDIDVGKAENSYPALRDAVNALGHFAQDTGLKPTCVVHSGMGLQAYWVLDKPLPADVWKRLATVFSVYVKQHGLIVDPKCTTDLARVMRLPGTVHQATGNVAKVVFDKGPVWNAKKFLGVMKETLRDDPEIAAVPQAVQAAPLLSGMAKAAEMTGMKPEPTADAAQVVRNCAAIMTAGKAAEPTWFAALSVLRSCRDGLEWAHKISALDKERYDYDDTERKFYHALENAPARCAAFKVQGCKWCKRCAFRDKVTSPIQLGRTRARVAVAVEVDEKPEEPPVISEDLPLPDKFDYPRLALQSDDFTVDHRGVVQHIWKKDASGKWSTEDIVLTTSRIYYTHSVKMEDNEAPRRKHWFIIEHACGKVERVPFVVQKDMTPQAIMKWFYEANVFPAHPSVTQGSFMSFMSAYLQSVVGKGVEVPVRDRFGWTEIYDEKLRCETEGFAVGGAVVTETGAHDVNYDDIARAISKDELTRKGALEEWKKVPRMYKTLNQKEGQLAMCLSFAAPFLRYAPGTAHNGIFSLWSREGGLGKSHVLQFCASVWGHPEKQFIQRTSSETLRSRKLGVLQNLPSYMDELTDVKDEDMYSLAYTLAGGQEKQKLKRSGADMVKTRDWKTVVFTSANKSFKKSAARVAGDSNATLLRVMEVECGFKDYSGNPPVKAYIDDCIMKCHANYGIAGPAFMYQVMKHRDRLSTLTQFAEQWAVKNNFKTNERYLSGALAIAIKVGRWAVEWGYLDYDMDALEDWVLGYFMGHNRAANRQLSVDYSEAIKTYLLDRQLHMLITEDEDRKPTDIIPARGAPDKFIINFPPREIYVRMERDPACVYIALSDLAAWCDKKNILMENLMRDLRRRGLSVHIGEKDFGKGVTWTSLPTVKVVRLSLAEMESVMGLKVEMTTSQQE